ncbi:HipA domain-containing protein [uncultured Desulfobacter sp.]|uniref:type II toxin-antitoxin system HipA family toxin n=1 Tax=uncultured Desulfobacter sp. TaxID=240139 RepID=UPI0029F47336|nr:HipA domain-containing protein [uncultured Desulfobacter sp.]
MNMTSEQQTTVYIYLAKQGYVPAGILKFFPQENISQFRYGNRYLLRPDAIPIDPVRIPLIEGEFNTSPRQALFNAFKDAAPDRWGRIVLSLVLGGDPDTLTDFHSLIALGPHHRIGALAFGPDPVSGPAPGIMPPQNIRLLDQKDNLKIIGDYVRMVDKISDEEVDRIKDSLPVDDLFQIFIPSLSPAGGARPKALVVYDGIEWIAKFPKRGDSWDEAVIEHACMTLAAKCGVNVAQTKIVKHEDINILLVKRFDKSSDGEPLHVISGFTLNDWMEDQEWGSYQTMADSARRYGAVNMGEQIFRRMAVNICCANTDDHPKNHAFFVQRDHIVLTPAYDIVPCRFAHNAYNLALGVGKQGRAATLKNALSNVAAFGLTPSSAQNILTDITEIFADWEPHFKQCGVQSKDITRVSRIFQHILRL